MPDGLYQIPTPVNEPVKTYAPSTPERARVVETIARFEKETLEIPVLAGSEEIYTGTKVPVVMPHAHKHVIANVVQSTTADVEKAIAGSLRVAKEWARVPFEERAAIFLRAADLLAGPWRERINAAAMLGQSKTVHQSEIDAVCELVDFLKFNVHFAQRLHAEQPISAPGMWNRSEYRPLEGFVLAVTPFNFLSIGVNLAAVPALLGNVVLWKPSNTAAFGSWLCLQMLREAGLPDGVISFIPGDGATQGDACLKSPHLAGINFTGSTRTFRHLWKGVAERLDTYRSFPRLVGETGGKDFIVAHSSADATALATATVRGGFEYQGQKCSAASRIYVPKSLWPRVRDEAVAMISTIRVGDVRDFSNFMGAVIDRPAFDRIKGYLELAKTTGKVLAGGTADDKEGFFVKPTLVEVADPKHRMMQEEIFGPVVTAWVYEDARYNETLDLIDETSPYALTGAVFARDRHAVLEAHSRLSQAAGNFYINDKPTGAVVGQQPFGGGRASGTNDKAGSLWNLIRWASPRTIKETFVPPTDYRYPYMG
ncbi:MAG: L-glutamate gamma-semialdehyde dehydrogenase [Sandaracinaceae bacterium]|nr:L-glutamate gamma-semialdehyde dehydrogenase [Sandaracinaceae bacterium]